MAAGRNASTVAFTLISTAILFGIFIGVINLAALKEHGYTASFGWQTPGASTAPGECDRRLVKKGFPFTTIKPADPADDPSGCLDDKNVVASMMNVAVCFVAAGIISVALVEGLRDRL